MNNNELASYFQSMAVKLYSDDGQLLTAPKNVADDDFLGARPHRFSKYFSDVDYHFSSQGIYVESLIEVDDALDDIGVNDFDLIEEGGTALCFRSGDLALRIGPNSPEGGADNNSHNVRSVCPLVLQPDFVVQMPDVGLILEGGLLVAVLDDDDIPEEYIDLVPKLLEGTCFEDHYYAIDEPYHGKDLGLLPDGTPILVDPDAIKDSGRAPLKEDFDKVRQNCERLQLPSPLSWVTKEGGYKQDLLHPRQGTKLIII